MFDYQTGYYEYNYRTLKEAQEAKKQAGKGAKITTFLSTNENMEQLKNGMSAEWFIEKIAPKKLLYGGMKHES